MRTLAFRFIVLLVLQSTYSNAQVLKPGFDIDEYIGVLQRCALQVDASFRGQLPKELTFQRVYRSPEQGLHNKFDVWQSKDKSIITINLRGTTSDFDSWLENFYSAMVPATGSLKLSDKYTFNYKLSNDPKATVHIGWTIGIGSIAPDVVDKIQKYYAEGARQIIVEGHSQGGALSYLMSSYLHYLIIDGKLPANIVIKTYCSAAPKPGNLYYAYDFDYITRGGWAFNIVNAADWVPETPFSIQTLRDMNKINPFADPMAMLHKERRVVRWYAARVYRRLDRSTTKAQRRFEKNLGKKLYLRVKKFMPEYEEPVYAHSSNFMRAGTPVVLQPDEEYYKRFPDSSANVFRHHLFEPYYFLAKKTYK